MKKKLFSTLAVLIALQHATFAAVLVNSTFVDSDLGASGRSTTNASNLTPWYLASGSVSSNLVVADDAVEGGLGRALELTTGHMALTNFTPVSLVNGQTMTLSFDYRYAAMDPEATGGVESLRVMLFSSGSAPLFTDDATNPSGDRSKYSGYFFGIGARNASVTNNTRIRSRSEGTTGNLNSTSGLTGGHTTSAGIASGVLSHEVLITMERVEDSLIVNLSVDGVFLHADRQFVNSPHFDFNTLIFSNNQGQLIYLDNITLGVVPEPAIASLLAGGLILLVVRCRNRKMS